MLAMVWRRGRVLPISSLTATGLAAAVLGVLLDGGCGAPVGGPGPGQQFDTATIFGEVLDATNVSQGIGNAYVYVPAVRSVAVGGRQEVIASDTTDAEGKYELPSVPTGTQTLKVDPPAGSGYGSFQVEFTVPRFVSRIRFVVTLLPSTITAGVLTIRPSNPVVVPGGRIKFAAEVKDAQGNIISVDPTWAVRGEIGVIDRDGLFTAGPTSGVEGQVVAQAGGVVGSTTVRVSAEAGAFNQSPTIDGVFASPNAVFLGETSTIVARAIDPDNDPLTYIWESEGGSITGTGQEVTWTAPSLRGTYRITCTVDDGRGGTAQDGVEVIVINRFPVISALTANPAETSPGGQVTLQATASDPDADTLTYTWEAAAGTFSGSGATVTWTAPAEAGFYFIHLRVEDGQGGFADEFVDVAVTDTQIIILGRGQGGGREP